LRELAQYLARGRRAWRAAAELGAPPQSLARRALTDPVHASYRPPMMQRLQPPFRADHVGSLIRPDALLAARQAAEQGKLAPAELLRIQHDAIRAVVRMQEEIGLRLATDGEFNRFSWQRDFLLKIGNVKPMESKLTVRFHSAAGTRDHTPPSLAVAGKLSRPAGIFVDDFKFLKSISTTTAKITIPSPTIVHFRGGREAIDAQAYPDLDAFYDDLAKVYQAEIADLAAAGCRYLQIDEVNLAYLCDPELRRQVANIGEDPDSLPQTYAKLLNAAVAGRPTDMTVCMHLCRGNFAGAWIADGGYEPIAELLFNAIDVDGYFLEYDSPRAGSFAPLRFLPKHKTAVLGLVTTKSPQLESKDELKRRIDEAGRYAPLEQLALSPQCGFSSGIGGQTMTVEDEINKLKLVVETAREVWGNA
jgi:5-methyltetrahydropteroyltriglutamate--homocysteine methyltransferase